MSWLICPQLSHEDTLEHASVLLPAFVQPVNNQNSKVKALSKETRDKL
jgi:hypothetical protein